MIETSHFQTIYRRMLVMLAPFVAHRIATGKIAIAGILFSMLLFGPNHYLFAAASIPFDPFLTADRAVEQSADCTLASYQVQPGDTLTGVADQASTTRERVRECNDLSSDVVYAGQTLALPNKVRSNLDTIPDTRVTRTLRATPPSSNRYQGPNNGSGPAYNNGGRHTRPPQRRRP